MRIYDVIVVGAGPGGSATAHYLAKEGLEVLLLDKMDFPRDKTCGDSLTPRALAVLQNMGVLDELLHRGHRIDELEVVAPNGRTVTAGFPQGNGVIGHSLVVPRLILDDILRQRAVMSGATFQGSVHVTMLEPRTTDTVVKGEQRGRTVSFTGRMAVVATGAGMKLLLRTGLLKEKPLLMLAARGYFEAVSELSSRLHFRFDGVPLPGYGWVFPLSASAANVGIGLLPRRRMPATPRMAFEAFTRTRPLQRLLAGARQRGPVKSYPLRADFATAPTYGPRVLLVGEAAGLVNPLTGEGVDYALESARIAAEQLRTMLAADDLSQDGFIAYDQALREHFQSLFRFSNRLRDLLINRPGLNWLVGTAARKPDFKMRLVNALLGYDTSPHDVSFARILKAAFIDSRPQ